MEATLEAVMDTSAAVVPGSPQAAKDLAILEREGLTSADVGAGQLKQAWSALSTVMGGGLMNMERVAYIESPETDTQVWVQRDVSRKRVRSCSPFLCTNMVLCMLVTRSLPCPACMCCA